MTPFSPPAAGRPTSPTGTGPQTIPPGVRVTGEIGGDAYVAAGGAEITGSIDGDFSGAAGMLDLAGSIGGDADISADEFSVSDAARIGGALKYTAPEQLELPAGVALDIDFDAPAAEESASVSVVGAIFRWILRTVAIVLGVAIVGWLLFRFRPNMLVRPAAAIRANPLQTGVYGLIAAALLVFIPIASLVLVAFIWTFWGAIPAIAMFGFLIASSALVLVSQPAAHRLLAGRDDRRADGRRALAHHPPVDGRVVDRRSGPHPVPGLAGLSAQLCVGAGWTPAQRRGRGREPSGGNGRRRLSFALVISVSA